MFGGGGRGAQGGAFGASGGNFSNANQTGSGGTPFGNQGYSGNQSSGMGGGFGSFSTGQQLGPQLNVRPTITSQILQGGEFTGLQDTVRMVVGVLSLRDLMNFLSVRIDLDTTDHRRTH